MDHVAIMKKSWGLTEKIITGEKRIESRWYKVKYPPWNSIKPDEIIYFKNSGEHVSVSAEVDKVLQFSNLTPQCIKEILEKYGDADGIETTKINEFYKLFKDKKYCMLIFLRNPRNVVPFEISKKGFGMMASWICVDEINKIKISNKSL